MQVCKTLKQKGVAPITIGTKYLWTAAAWFDYLNIRINGLPFHMELMDGKASYTDPKVKAVFAKWRELIDPGYYIDNHTSYSWQEAAAFLYQGQAAMYLMGNFMVPGFPADVADKIDFFPFPTVKAGVPAYEEAPTDILAIPAKAKNKAGAKKFLAYVSQPQILREMSDAFGMLSPHKDSGTKDDRFLKAGAALLSNASGLAQFYDRDTRPEMAKDGMKGFQEFMVKPDRLDAILKRVERTRKRIFKK